MRLNASKSFCAPTQSMTLPRSVIIRPLPAQNRLVIDDVFVIRSPTHREFYILSHLQGKTRQDWMPFSVSGGGEPVYNEDSKQFRAFDLYHLLGLLTVLPIYEMVKPQSPYVAYKKLFLPAEGNVPVAELLGGVPAVADLSTRIERVYIKRLPRCFVPTVFVSMDDDQ